VRFISRDSPQNNTAARLKPNDTDRLKAKIPRKWLISLTTTRAKTGVAGIEPCHAQSNENLTYLYFVEL
jgi:hypothetical protein